MRETITPGAHLRVGGAYTWGDGDWRFLAYFVWRPNPSLQPGHFLFNVNTTRPAGTPAKEWHDAMLSHGSPPPRHLRTLLGV